MAPETTATTESCKHRLRRLERIESPLIAQLAAAIGHLRTAGEHADPAQSLAHYPGRTVRDLTSWVGGNVQMIAELLVPLIAPHTRVEITSYGVLHQDPPLGDALTLDLTTALRNPPEDPEVREVMLHASGLDQVVYDYVLATPGAVEIAERTVLRVLAQAAALPGWPVALHVYCRGGKHRSVVLARKAGELLRDVGADVGVTHRHVHLPVVEIGMATVTVPSAEISDDPTGAWTGDA
ncbi:RNase adapter RapZ [Kitasatospora sp. NPDC004669]|uniref:RapZ C-terminal domain-containing protein n=1 Tax=Kitasatospora sp. NPDC004669 TaxID=3154555 RepID=UPI0033A0432A